jgi:hypothetical protein
MLCLPNKGDCKITILFFITQGETPIYEFMSLLYDFYTLRCSNRAYFCSVIKTYTNI